MSISAVVLAATMMASTNHFGMSITPSAVEGPSQSHAVFVVSDIGTTPLSVHIQTVELREIANHPGHLAVYGEADAWAKVQGPESFTLKPGERHAVKIVVRAPTAHRYTLGVAAEGQVPKVTSGAAVQVEAVGRYTVNSHGTPVPNQAPIQAEGTPQHHTSPIAPIGALAGLSALLLAAGVWLRRRMNRHVS